MVEGGKEGRQKGDGNDILRVKDQVGTPITVVRKSLANTECRVGIEHGFILATIVALMTTLIMKIRMSSV